ncbi:uncharacterized protein LOC116343614 [Contarinia nasturtii]|uniref:uncharacterized protein LOC116343614 n=1 Tax=Contarinia nasturtii TaxID=265458 RepID=UPI0012D3DB0E|nr:uncharacterized protein LOC116343614 [Contarinia nasturtii]
MTKLSLIIATSFIVQLIYIKNTTPSFTTAIIKARSISAENQVKRITENLTLAIDSHDTVEARYDAFKAVIDRIGRNCRKVAFQSIIDKANVTNSSDIKAQVEDYYVKHVKNTAAQSKQAILERQVTQHISQGAAVQVRATCQQMLNIAKNRIKAAKNDA